MPILPAMRIILNIGWGKGANPVKVRKIPDPNFEAKELEPQRHREHRKMQNRRNTLCSCFSAKNFILTH
jgi:hypothetical protein